MTDSANMFMKVAVSVDHTRENNHKINVDLIKLHENDKRKTKTVFRFLFFMKMKNK